MTRSLDRSVPATVLCVLAGAALLAGCEKKYEFDPPSREERVEEAERLYTPALFDTISWESAEERNVIGNAIYAARCRRCHGTLGRGETEYARERDLEVPSLVEPEWRFAGDVEAARREVFTGHPVGMPTRGVAGLTPREMDAVTHYVVDQLREDVLGGGGGAELPGTGPDTSGGASPGS